MKLAVFLVVCFSLLVMPGLAEEPFLSVPSTIEVLGNGLHCVAFMVKLEGVPEGEEENFSYALKGLPADAPQIFDKTSRIFFWRPEPNQTGLYKFEFVAEHQTGWTLSKSSTVKVLRAPTLEALPKGWEDKKKEEKYLTGRNLLPSSNFLEMEIAALPEYELEIKVKDSMDEEYTLTYVPKEGGADVNKGLKTALIKLGGMYATERVKMVRRDLYEDLFSTFKIIFKRIESVKLRGNYLLKDFRIFAKETLVSATGIKNIYPPVLNLTFDDSFYQEALYSKENPMMISDSPVIKIDFNTTSGLVWKRSRLFIDEAEYHAARGDFTLVVVKPYKDASSFDVNYAMYMLRVPAAKKLAFGEHLFVFEAENAYGMLATKEAYARVVSLPAQVVGKPLVYPSPFNPSRDLEVKIQYQLSLQTNVELIIFSVDGSTVMRKKIAMGEEGGKKGYNTVAWDGKTAAGFSVPNGIYSGVIIDRDENRILEKFMITVYR